MKFLKNTKKSAQTKAKLPHSETYPNIAVVVCASSATITNWPTLLEAIQALQSQTFQASQIILVADQPELLMMLQQAKLEGVTVVKNPVPGASAEARNAGIALARTEVVAFLDWDTIAKPNWLAQLNQHYVNPQVVGVGGKVSLNANATLPKWLPSRYNWVYGCTYEGLFTVCPSQVSILAAGNMSFRREVFIQLGGFRNWSEQIAELPAGEEETELCLRISQCWPQKKLIMESAACVERGPIAAEQATWAYFRQRCYAKGVAKARIAQLLGRHTGLVAERKYIRTGLPVGLAAGLANLFRRQASLNLMALLTGSLCTSRGFFKGHHSIEQALKERQHALEAACVAESNFNSSLDQMKKEIPALPVVPVQREIPSYYFYSAKPQPQPKEEPEYSHSTR
jgi:hypothetical protein